MNEKEIIEQYRSTKLDIEHGATIVMFGGKSCGVCKVVWPQLLAKLEPCWPDLKFQYIDCESDPQCCAQNSVFSLPVIRLYFDGRKYLERIQVFSLGLFVDEVNRLCQQYEGAGTDNQ